MNPQQPKQQMSKEDAARIQAAEAKKGDGGVAKGDFAARAQVTTRLVFVHGWQSLQIKRRAWTAILLSVPT